MIKRKFRRYFITGLIAFLPIFITINVLFMAIRFIDNLLGRYINPYFEDQFGVSFFGLGFLTIILVIFFTGFLATNVFLKRIMPRLEGWFLRIPLVHQIYPSLKQLIKFLFSSEKIAFKKVVLFEYPRKDVYTLGFVTNEFSLNLSGENRIDAVCVYISSAPNPITGFFVIVPRKDVIFLDISVEEAFKIIISGGVLMNSDLFLKKAFPKSSDERA